MVLDELEMRIVSSDNPGQNMLDKFTKLSKIRFSLECFTADFLQVSSTTIKIYLLRDRLGTHHQFQKIHKFS